MQADTLIIGAGPAGLTTAYQLAKVGRSVVIVERDPRYVGGISRTVEYKGYRFDIGGHRFFSKSAEVEALWTELLADELLERPRSSRIFYKGKFFHYPLRANDALGKLGIIEAVRCLVSFGKARLFPIRHVRSFEDWVVNNFGRRLFEIFFKTYTEKVWGMDCSEISADWAAQRIKGLSLTTAIIGSLGLAPAHEGGVIKTLIGSFRYPRLGPGQMWERARDRVVQMGGTVFMGSTVSRLTQERASKRWQAEIRRDDGSVQHVTARHVVSTMAMNELVALVEPEAAPALARAASALRYRDFLLVALITRGEEQFNDNWIYIHDPGVEVGRVQNFRSWSPDMVPVPGTACYGMEYFCFEGDGQWMRPDEDLIRHASAELVKLGLAAPDAVIDGCVVRQPKAYPVYDDLYAFHVDTIRESLEQRYANLHLAGRNGMHRYNNQDHAMMTGMLTAANVVAGFRKYDPWRVNEDAEYHEADAAGSMRIEERLVPRRA